MVGFVKCAVALVFVAFMSIVPAQAQDVTPEHVKAAKSAMIATGATSRLDGILPEIASFTKAGLIANRPDIEAEISNIVDETAISLAARRGALENEVAAIYTKLFTMEELNQIETFFSSEAGIKFLGLTPRIFKRIDNVSKVWRTGITRDMNEMVNAKLKEQGLQ
jgi:hypothetical protein